jgi:hypothetical protein
MLMKTGELKLLSGDVDEKKASYRAAASDKWQVANKGLSTKVKGQGEIPRCCTGRQRKGKASELVP